MAKVSLGGRVDQEDYDYVMGLNVPGAKGVSDRLRWLIQQSRNKEVIGSDFQTYLDSSEQKVAPLRSTIRAAEHANDMHSEALLYMLDWLPEMAAYMMTETERLAPLNDRQLLKLESGFMHRASRLMNTILRMSVTKQFMAYDDQWMHEFVDSTTQLISMKQDKDNKHG